jgi:hypothetical protein
VESGEQVEAVQVERRLDALAIGYGPVCGCGQHQAASGHGQPRPVLSQTRRQHHGFYGERGMETNNGVGLEAPIVSRNRLRFLD